MTHYGDAELIDGLTQLCRREITEERLRINDEECRYPFEIMEALGKAGWGALAVPVEAGGAEASMVTLAAVHEELSYHSLAVGQAYFSLWVLGGEYLARLGTAAQQKDWLPRLCAGQARVAFAITEPDCGSDAAALQSRAEQSGGNFLLRGQKVFITGAAVSDVIIVAARTGTNADPRRSMTLFLVNAGAPGVTIRKLPKIGLRSLDLCEVFFEDVRLSQHDVLGEVEHGWQHMRPSLARERLILAAISAGGLRDTLQLATDYATQRTSFGKRIGDHQLIAGKLVDMRVALEASRGLIRTAAELIDQGEDASESAAMAKIFATEAYVNAARQGVQVFGGYGFTDEYPIARHYRDCKYLEIGGGTSEIQRIVVARAMGLKP